MKAPQAQSDLFGYPEQVEESEPVEIVIIYAGRHGRTRRLERDGVLISQEKR